MEIVSAQEIFNKIKILDSNNINVKKLLFEIAIIKEDILKKERLGYLYLAENGKNLCPILIFSKYQINLGNQKLYLKRGAFFEGSNIVHDLINTERQINLILDSDKNIKKSYGKAALREERSCFKAGVEFSHTTYIYQFLKKENIEIFTNIEAVEKDDIKKLSKEEIDYVFSEYISQGHDLATEITSIMKTSLIQFTHDEENMTLMKYRPHAIIIKAPKVGVSTISTRIGINISSFSPKSIEGFADAEGNITYSSLHDKWGHINLDEFLRMEEHLLQHMFNFLELGQFITHKAGREIINYGAPRICFTTNPVDIEGIVFNEKTPDKFEVSEESPFDENQKKVTLYTNDDLEKNMFAVFKSSVEQLSTVSNAAFSRVGIIIFDPKMKAAKKREDSLAFEQYEKINSIAKSIINYLKDYNVRIFKENENWLNCEIKEYNIKIDEMTKNAEYLIKNAWEGHKEAYKHIRGYALSEAIIDNAYTILNENYKKNEIIEDAELSLDYVIKINLNSMKTVLTLSETFVSDKEVIKTQIEKSKLSYFKMFMFVYSRVSESHQDGEFLLYQNFLLEFRKCFHEIDEKFREENFGRYTHYSRFEQRLNLERLKREFKNVFNKQLFSSNFLVIYKNIFE